MSSENAVNQAEAQSGKQTAGGYLASTVKHGGIYALGTLLAKGVGFIMLPVYTRVLTTADYGILEILSLSTDILGMLVGLGVRQAVMRYYYQYDNDQDRNGVISTASLLLLLTFGLTAFVGLAFSVQLTDLLLGPDQPNHYVQLAVIAFALGALGDIPGVYLQARQQSKIFVAASTARLILALSLNIVLVVFLHLGVVGIFMSTIISSIVIGGYMIWQMLCQTGIRFVNARARELILFGAPLMVWQVGSFVLHFSDRYFLRYERTLSDVGLYALAYKLAMLLGTFIIGPFRDIWIAKSLEIARREGPAGNPILASIMRHYNMVLVGVGLGIALFSTDVIHLMLGAQFAAASETVPLLVVAVVFFGYRQISQTGAMIAGRSGLIAWSTTIAAGGAVILNMLLIPPYGAMGAAIATAGAFLLEFLVMRRFSLHVHPVTVPLHVLAQPILLAAMVWTGAALVVPEGAHPLLGLGIRIAAGLAFLVGALVTGIITTEERGALAHIIRDPRSLLVTLRKA